MATTKEVIMRKEHILCFVSLYYNDMKSCTSLAVTGSATEQNHHEDSELANAQISQVLRESK